MIQSSNLVQAQWLNEHLSNSEVIVIDTRFSLADPQLGERQYRTGHIPGAYYLDLDRDLSGPIQDHGGRHPLPDWEDFVTKLNRMGLQSKPATQVVIYDDSRFAFASRLWWMLRYLGHKNVAILDGGFRAWTTAGLPLEIQAPDSQEGNFLPSFQQEWIVDIEAVKGHRQRTGGVVIDSRSPARYRGEVEPIDPIAGSIPGAINAFWQKVTTEEGFLKNPERLADQWSNLTPDSDAIFYCGSGVTACVNLFALTVLGHPMHKLYPGGWSDWCSYLV